MSFGLLGKLSLRAKLLDQHPARVLAGDVDDRLVSVRVCLQRVLDLVSDRRVHQLPGDRPCDLDVNYRALRLHHFSSSSIRPEGQPGEQRLSEPQVQHAHAAAALASGEQLPYALLR